MKKYLILLLLLIPSLSFAACPGTPADCYTSCGEKCLTVIDASQPAVQAALTAVTSEDEWWTVNVPASDGIEWTTGVTAANKKVKLVGGSGGSTTTLTANTSASLLTFNITTYPIEVSNFIFNGTISGYTGYPIKIDKFQSGNTTKVNGVRVYNNTFNINAKSYWKGYVYGLIDGNTFSQAGSYFLIVEDMPADAGTTIDTFLGSVSWNRGIDFSTFGADAVYLENNTSTVPSLAYFVDSTHGSRVVARYNNLTNSVLSMHGIGQSSTANRGSFVNVFHNNKILYNLAGWSIATIKILGGTGLAFNNTSGLTGSGTGTFYSQVQSYRSNPSYSGGLPWSLTFGAPCSATNEYVDGGPDGPTDGYPCGDNTGTSGALGLSGQTITPYYAWNNKQKGVAVKLAPISSDTYTVTHTQNNRDYYDQDDTNCPTKVDGDTACTAGVGVGTQRPDHCTAGTAYFETDENSLYKCASTDTWAKYFEPYTCPHPLAGSGTCGEAAGKDGYLLGGTPPTYTATSSVVNLTGGTVSGAQSVESGSTATFTNEAFNGWKFKAWAGTCGCTGTGACAPTITADCTVTAEFEQITLNTFCR